MNQQLFNGKRASWADEMVRVLFLCFPYVFCILHASDVSVSVCSSITAPACGFMLNFVLALPILCYCSTNEWYNRYFMHIITCRHCFNAQYLCICCCCLFFISVCTTFEKLCSFILFTKNSNSTDFSSYFMYIYFIIIDQYVSRGRKMYAHVNTITSIFVFCGQNADARFSYTIWGKKWWKIKITTKSQRINTMRF